MKETKDKKVKYYLNDSGEFVIENYNHSKPFANFFPGIAGEHGIPMWVFYVNRGQGIASFGTKDKDHSILEFFPANKSWQFVSTHGFRTFIKISGKKDIFYEPFHNGFTNLNFKLENKMSINSSGLKIEEINSTIGLKVTIDYFNIPQDSFAGLARIVTITNLTRRAKKIQLLDGLPQITPFGTSNLFLKKLGRTIEAWMRVENLKNNVPFFKLDVDPTDRPEIIHIKEGNFYLTFRCKTGKPEIIRPITDPEYVFGPVTDFSCPRQFIFTKKFTLPKNEDVNSKTPCAFSLLELNLSGQGEKTFYSLIGYMRNKETLNSSIKRIADCKYLARKKEENEKVIEELKQDIDTCSSSKEFDLYAKQTYLDNIMRGGYPITFGDKEKKTIFYLYSRKHGDLERDYNKFYIEPTYFSQGNGNYRDVNQNRRADIWFNPDIKDENLIYFFNLLQADGFNPLVVKGASFTFKDGPQAKIILNELADEAGVDKLLTFLKHPFTPGKLIFFIEENKIGLKASYAKLLGDILAHCQKNQEAEHGEGFWTDHWHYNLDLLENYLGVYPEKLKEIVFQKKCFTYYDNTEIIKPRNEKYLLYHGLPRQLHSIAADTAKKEIIAKRSTQPHLVRTDSGHGEIYQTTLISKLLCLTANKLASLDPGGCGIEMEANKPNWFDALNGLPALFGSSACETFELKRLLLFIKSAIEETKPEKILVTEEVCQFLIGIGELIKGYLQNNSPEKDFQYWDKSYTLKEEYRQKTKLGFSGKETELSIPDLTTLLNNALEKIDSGLNKAYDKKENVYYGYFINEVTKYETIKEHFIKPTQFSQKKLPFFLEGQMHALRMADVSSAKTLYNGTKKSSLYDKELKMYKVTAPLGKMPEEIGRCRVFTPGWLENESVWLHMEYKYLLEILKSGLYEEFYAEFKNLLIPFQNPQNYGRSILENSSFLVSSAFPDKNLHGNGFVARLSGSTAEFIEIWLTMNLGKNPFRLDENNKLCLQFKPALAGWLFDKKGSYSFNFLRTVRINYHNPKKKNTFGKNAAACSKIILANKNGGTVTITSDNILSPYAEQIRSGQIKQIDIYLD